MDSGIENVVRTVITAVARAGEAVTKTKLLKLLYLFDLEYFRSHRETFTGFTWKYYHLGPWAREYDGVLQDLADRGLITCSASNDPDFDTCFLECTQPVDLSGPLENCEAESPLRMVLNTWAGRSTRDILDYVYFHTEPMQHSERGDALDFSTVPEQAVQKYKRSSSGKSAEEIGELRKKLSRRTAVAASNTQTGGFTPPNYDEAFYDFLAKLEADE